MVEYSDENVFFPKKVDFWGQSSKSKGYFISTYMVKNGLGIYQTRSKSNFLIGRVVESPRGFKNPPGVLRTPGGS